LILLVPIVSKTRKKAYINEDLGIDLVLLTRKKAYINEEKGISFNNNEEKGTNEEKGIVYYYNKFGT